MKVTFEVDGRIKFIYDDSVAEVVKEVGQLTIKRASHVEPALSGAGGMQGWIADMSPVGGPVLPSSGGSFKTRSDALRAEREWLVANNIPRPL